MRSSLRLETLSAMRPSSHQLPLRRLSRRALRSIVRDRPSRSNHIIGFNYLDNYCSLTVIRCFARYPPGPRIRSGTVVPVRHEGSWNGRQPAEDFMTDKPRAIVITLGILFLMSWPLSGQQTYVSQFDAYGGYGFLLAVTSGTLQIGISLLELRWMLDHGWERNQRRGSGKVRQKCRKTIGASRPAATLQKRSEERRVGKECRYRRVP